MGNSGSPASGVIGAASWSLFTRGGGRKYLTHAERGRVLRAFEALLPDQALFAQTLTWTGPGSARYWRSPRLHSIWREGWSP